MHTVIRPVAAGKIHVRMLTRQSQAFLCGVMPCIQPLARSDKIDMSNVSFCTGSSLGATCIATLTLRSAHSHSIMTYISPVRSELEGAGRCQGLLLRHLLADTQRFFREVSAILYYESVCCYPVPTSG